MKKYFFLSLLLSLTIFSCGKSDETTEVDKLDPQGDCFTAKIDGQLFQSDNATATDLGALGMTLSATYGNVDGLQTFGIAISNTTAGTYDVAPQAGVNQASATYSDGVLTGSNLFGSTSGSLTVTENDVTNRRIKGTFNFEGEDDSGGTIQITEGVFDIGY